MKKHGIRNSVICLLLVFILSGCAHAVSYEMRQRVKRGLSFSDVLRNPEAHAGQTVMWGGKIIEVRNREGTTVIKILQTPLDSYGVPMDEEYSQGRFLAMASGYVDAEVYRQGRMVTVAGEIAGKDVEPIGEMKYTYPVVQAREMRLWKDPPEYGSRYRPYWYWDWYGYPYSYPWPYHGRGLFFFP